jgi:hypothetical protein
LQGSFLFSNQQNGHADAVLQNKPAKDFLKIFKGEKDDDDDDDSETENAGSIFTNFIGIMKKDQQEPHNESQVSLNQKKDDVVPTLFPLELLNNQAEGSGDDKEKKSLKPSTTITGVERLFARNETSGQMASDTILMSPHNPLEVQEPSEAKTSKAEAEIKPSGESNVGKVDSEKSETKAL